MFSSQEVHLYIRGGLLYLIVSLWGIQQPPLLLKPQSERKKRGEGEKKRREKERDVRGSRVGLIQPIDILWPLSQADSLHDWFYFTQPWSCSLGERGSLSFRPLTHSGSWAFDFRLRDSFGSQYQPHTWRVGSGKSSPLFNMAGLKWMHC